MTTYTRSMRTLVLLAVILAALLSGASITRAAASKIVVVLPGQTFVQGAGAVGTPDPVVLRQKFRVEAYAVDSFGNIAYDYEGPIVTPVVPVSGGSVGPPPARRYGMTVSHINAPTSIAAGSLRISLGGGPFQQIAVGPAGNPAAVCQALEAAVHAVPPALFDNGDFDFFCRALSSPIPGSLRYALFLDDAGSVRTTPGPSSSGSGGSLIAIDPTFGLAQTLGLGAPAPSSNPADPAEYAMRTLIPAPLPDQRFSRGIAFFEVALASMDQVGPGRTIDLDQGGGPALPVEASVFDVEPPAFGVASTTALGDGSGRIHRARFVLTQPVVAGTVGSPSDFSLESPGLPPMPGTSLTVTSTTVHGHAADQIEVTFGTGLGRTDLQDIEIRYTPPSSNHLTGVDTGASLPAFTVSQNTTPRLIDGAPPVLVSAFGQDIDGNNGLDRVVFFLSEPVSFSAGRGLSLGALFDPAIDPASMTIPVPFDLRIRQIGLATFEDVVQVTDPGNAAATSLTGADAIAAAITDAVQRARPAYLNFTCTFVSGRYVMRAGIPLNGSQVQVLPTGTGSDGAPALKLGPVNGGVERPGRGDALTGLPSDLCVRGQNGANLLLGKTESDLVIAGNSLTLNLTNVPNSGTGTPGFLWRDDGDLSFVTDTSSSRLRLEPIDSIGLASFPHPSGLLQESSSTTASDGSLVRTVATGDVTLDGSPSFVPLNAPGPGTAAEFRWTQVSGPLAVMSTNDNGIATMRLTVPAVYTFQLVVHMTLAPDPPVYNPYTDADGTLARRLVLTVQPGPQTRSVVVLPGQSLIPGAESTNEVLGGYALVQTEGTPFEVKVYETDEFFNVVTGPPGATVRLATTDPGDVEPSAQAFVGGVATFTLTPSHAATFMVPEVDDEVLVAFEHGDIHWPYVAGRLWNVHALPRLAAAPTLARFTWDDDPRAVRWNIYRTSLSALADLNHDGLPDLGYGSCVSDPDPSDLYFEDAAMPPAGDGFMYAARESLVAAGVVQAAGLGLTSAGIVRPAPGVCP